MSLEETHIKTCIRSHQKLTILVIMRSPGRLSFEQNILDKLPDHLVKLDSCFRDIQDRYSDYYVAGMEMCCAYSVSDNRIAFMPLAESCGRSYYLSEEKRDIGLLREIQYQITPTARKQCSSDFNFSVKVGPPVSVEFYIASYCRQQRGEIHQHNSRQSRLNEENVMRKRLLPFIDRYKKAGIGIAFNVTDRYPDRYRYRVVSGAHHTDALCGFFAKVFGIYHDTEIMASIPRFNLHIAFDSGFLKEFPLELKELIMDKIDCGKLSYVPGQLQLKGLSCFGL